MDLFLPPPPWGGKLSKMLSPLCSHYYLKKKIQLLQQLGKRVVFHGHANFNLPLGVKKLPGVRYIITVHDMIPLLEGAFVSKGFYLQFLCGMKFALKKADHIIAVSEWTKKCLVQRYPQIEDKITIIPHGVLFHQKKQPIRVRKTQNIINLLFVSRYEKYKRFEMLGEILGCNKQYFLTVVTDKKGFRFLHKKYECFVARGQLEVLTNIATESLSKLYERADVYIHPSFYEGYCLPVRDALLVNLPVVYCKGSAVDELVAEDSGVGLLPTAPVQAWDFSIKKSLCKSVKKNNTTFNSYTDAAKNLLKIYNST